MADPVASGEQRLWHRVTIDFDGPSATESAETFRDFRLDVTFTHTETGETLVVPGFFAADGNAAESGAASGTVWRVHFNPPLEGEWTYSASMRTGEDVAASTDPSVGTAVAGVDGQGGTLTIADTDKTGDDFRAKGMLTYVGEHYLQHAGDESWFIKAGADSPENFLAYEGFDGTVATHEYVPHLADWEIGDPTWGEGEGKGIIGAVNYLAEEGLNSIYMITMNVEGDGKDVWPWVADDQASIFDVSKLAQWEIVFEHMDAKGLMLHVVTQEIENNFLLNEGDLGVERAIYYRELIARFGHHNGITWNLGEENSNTPEQRQAFADYFEAVDPYQHLTVIHTWPNLYDETYLDFLGDGNLDGVSLQVTEPRAELLKWIELSEAAGRPWVVSWDETGPPDVGVLADDAVGAEENHDDLRNRLWQTLTAGGAGVEWYFGLSDQSLEDFRSRDSVWDWTVRATGFFSGNDLPLIEMEVLDEATPQTGDFIFAKPGEVYVIYQPVGELASLDLTGIDGTFLVSWYDPTGTGGLIDGATASVEGGSLVSLGQPPDTEGDWAILVRLTDADVIAAIDGLEDQALAPGAEAFDDLFALLATGTALTAIVVLDLPDHGLLTLDGAPVTANQTILAADLGDLLFTPEPDFSGTARIRWQPVDASGPVDAEALLDLNLAPVNDDPVAMNDGLLVANAGQTLLMSDSLLLANDSDADHDVLSIVEVSGAVNGQVLHQGSVVSFLPNPGHTGPASFTYTIEDAAGVRATAQVSLLVIEGEATEHSLSANGSLAGTGVKDWGEGVTIQAFQANGAPGQVFFEAGGLGVAGDRFDGQIGYQGNSQTSQALLLEFENGATDLSIRVGRLNPTESGGLAETGRWIALDEAGAQIGSGRIDPADGTSTGNSTFEIPIDFDGTLHALRIEATGYGNGANPTAQPDNSDFNLLELSFTTPASQPNQPPLVISALPPASIAEEQPLSTFAAPAFFDLDGDALSYSATLDGGAPLPGWLSINSVTGELTGVPDDADVGTLDLEIMAADLAGSASTELILTVLPVNDAPVLLTPVQDISVVEGESTGADLSSHFHDVDGPVLTFSLELAGGGDLPDWLVFNSDGTLSASPPGPALAAFTLDAAPPAATAPVSLDLIVTASDGLEVETDSFSFMVTEPPAVPQLSGDSADIDENAPAATAVGQLIATPSHTGSSLSYRILSGDPEGRFVIDPLTGAVAVAAGADLDFESQSTYQLLVEATEQPVTAPAGSTTALLTIDLNDLNEAPVVVNQGFVLAEGAGLGATVGDVVATDPDAGDSITYEIIDGDPNGIFEIDPDTGEITLAKPQLITGATHDLTVQVTDSATPALTGSATVQVETTVTPGSFSLFIVTQDDFLEDGAPTPLATIVRSGDISRGALVSYAISGDVDGADLQGMLNGVISFAPGQADAVLPVSVFADDRNEPDENLTIDVDRVAEHAQPSTGFDWSQLFSGDTPNGLPRKYDLPELASNAVVIDLAQTDSWQFNLADDQDAIFLGGAAEDMPYRLQVIGGRDIVMLGGTFAPTRDASSTLRFDDVHGSVFIDGVHIDNTAVFGEDGIVVGGADGTEPDVTIQNSLIENIGGTLEGTHGDVFQPQGPLGVLRVYNLTGSSNYQGFFLEEQPDRSGAELISVEMENVNLRHTPGDHLTATLLFLGQDYPTSLTNVFVTEKEGTNAVNAAVYPSGPVPLVGAVRFDNTIIWPELPVTGEVEVGLPPSGDFVRPQDVGGVYVPFLTDSPGFVTGAQTTVTIHDDDDGAGTFEDVTDGIDNDGDGEVDEHIGGPSPATLLSDREVETGSDFSFLLPSPSFSDPDEPYGDVLSLSATLQGGAPLPDWLDFDSATGRFSGVPAQGDAAILTVVVQAEDLAGNQSTLDFNLVVKLPDVPPPAGDPVRIEGEDFANSPGGFRIEDLPGLASDDQALTVKYLGQDGPAGGQPITTSTPYTGPSGTFDVFFGGFDESDGDSRIVVRISGQRVADFVLDESPGGTSPAPNTAVRREVALSLDVETGDLVEVTIYRDSGEYTRFDYIEFVPLVPANPPVGAVSDTDATPNAIAENAAAGTLAGITASASDPDAGDTVSYTIDDNRFSVDAGGVVRVAGGAVFDAETEPAIGVTVTASSTDGSTSQKVFAIGVTDVNEAPVGPVTDKDGSANSISENVEAGAIVGITGFAADPDAMASVTYAIDDGRFAIDPVTGQVTVATAGAFDAFSEAAIDLEITAASSDGSASSQTFTVLVTETPPPSADPVRLEAENFANRPGGFKIESWPGIASSNETLTVKYNSQGGPNSGQPITTSTAFNGPDGSYDVFLGAFDEDDGDSRITVRIGGQQVADFVLDQDPAGGDPALNTAVRREVALSLDVESGDQIEITVYRDRSEYTRLDFIEFVPLGPPTGPVGPVSDINANPNSIAEDAAADTLVGLRAFADDPDPGEGVSYAIDDARFSIDALGVVRVAAGAAFDHETEPSINVTVTATSADTSTSTRTFAIDVTDVNEQPDAVDDALEMKQATVLRIPIADLLANDTDPDGDSLDMGLIFNKSHGTVDIDGSEVVYTPFLAHTGIGGFDYTVTDGRGGSDTATVRVDVIENIAPVAVDDEAETFENTPVRIAIADLLFNDFDLDDESLLMTAVSNSLLGTAEIDGTDVLFTPTADQTGQGGFDYTLSDGRGGTDTGYVAVDITVPPPNQDPVAVDDEADTDEGVPVRIAIADLLSNDFDLDTDTLSLVSVSGGVLGTAQIDGDDVVFTPTGGESGLGGFDYTVSDGRGGTDVGSVEVTIAPNTDPVAVDDEAGTDEGVSVRIAIADLLSNDFDLDFDTVTLVSVGNSILGSAQIDGDDVVFTPTGGESGLGGFDYTVSDGRGGTDIGSVEVTIEPNIAPVAVDDEAQTPENTAVRIAIADLLVNDFDLDTDTLSLVSVGNGTLGSAQIDGTDVVFTPAAEQFGLGGFEYIVSDGRGGTDTGFVEVEIEEFVAPPVPHDLVANGSVAGSGVRTWSDEVTVQAFEYDGDSGAVAYTGDGFGVDNGRFDSQIDWDGASQRSESLVFSFANGASDLDIQLGRVNPSEYGGQPETGRWEAYDDVGGLLASGMLDPRDGTLVANAVYEIDIAYEGVLHELHVFATGYGNGAYPTRVPDNSDFSIRALHYESPGDHDVLIT